MQLIYIFASNFKKSGLGHLPRSPNMVKPALGLFKLIKCAPDLLFLWAIAHCANCWAYDNVGMWWNWEFELCFINLMK